MGVGVGTAVAIGVNIGVGGMGVGVEVKDGMADGSRMIGETDGAESEDGLEGSLIESESSHAAVSMTAKSATNTTMAS